MTADESMPVALCVLPELAPNRPRTTAYPGYIHEILQHAGLAYSTVPPDALGQRLGTLQILITVGDAELPRGMADWVVGGGMWLAIGGTCGLSDVLGVRAQAPDWETWGGIGGAGTLGEGYLNPLCAGHPALGGVPAPLHFFNGVPVRHGGGAVLAGVLDAHGRPTGRAALTENRPGRGIAVLIAPDLAGSVVRIRQGIAVTRDGVPAADGSAPTADAVLKSGDGCVLDWILDRRPVAGASGLQAFVQPIADQWCELLLRVVFYLAREARAPLPLLWLYPRSLPALGHMSHDSDLNDPRCARLLLEVLRGANVQSTWCIILPGYSPELMEEIGRAGHELALHYDAMTEGCEWGEAELDKQWRELKSLFTEQPVTNKNHYTRWEGDTEFFEWLNARGVTLDQSKGASKTGEAGFNFGTCHPMYPVARNGASIPVLELPTPTQDSEVFAPVALQDPLLTAALRHHGVLHVLFHPAHIGKPGVADALRRVVSLARDNGMEWRTAREISAWERARRTADWRGYRADERGAAVTLEVGEDLPDATVLWLDAGADGISVDGPRLETDRVTRWGFRFRAATLDLLSGASVTVERTPGT